MPDAYILGIESSCDETAAAVVRSGEQLISNVVASQIATHQPYGGVVPELASREHLRAIVPVVRQALIEAKRSYDSVDAIAVTQGPGLAGALLVGIGYAKALAFALDKPLIAVNHLEGHIHAVLLEERQKGNHELQFPVLALVVSGGHTHLYLAAEKNDSWTYEISATLATTPPARPSTKSLSFSGSDIPEAPSSIGSPRTAIPRRCISLRRRSSIVIAAIDATAEQSNWTTTVRASISPTAASRRRSCVTSSHTTCVLAWNRDARRWRTFSNRSWKITSPTATS